jgi:hypothetical protein
MEHLVPTSLGKGRTRKSRLRDLPPLTAEAVKALTPLLGAPPVLSSENLENYTGLWLKRVEEHRPCDLTELGLVRQMVDEEWTIQRYRRHQTLAIEARLRASAAFQVQRANAQKALRDRAANALAEKTGGGKTELSRLRKLEETILSTADDVDAIAAGAPAEIEHHLALEGSLEIQQRYDHLIDSAVRRRDGALEILVISRRAGLGRNVEEEAETIIEAELIESEDVVAKLAASALPPEQSPVVQSPAQLQP